MKEVLFKKTNQEFTRLFHLALKSERTVLINTENSPDLVRAAFALSFIIRNKQKNIQTNIFIRTEKRNDWKFLKNFNSVVTGENNSNYVSNYKTICDLGTTENGSFSLLLKIKQDDNTHEVLELRSDESSFFTELIFRAFPFDTLFTNTEAKSLLFEVTQDPNHLLRFKNSPIHASVLVEEIFDLLPKLPESYLSLNKQLSAREVRLVTGFLENIEHHDFIHWPRLTSFFIDRRSLEIYPDSEYELNEAARYTISQFGTLTFGSVWSILVFPAANGSVKVIGRSKHSKAPINKILEHLSIGTGNRETGSGSFARDSRTIEPELYLREILHHLHGHEYDPVLDKLIESPYDIENLP